MLNTRVRNEVRRLPAGRRRPAQRRNRFPSPVSRTHSYSHGGARRRPDTHGMDEWVLKLSYKIAIRKDTHILFPDVMESERRKMNDETSCRAVLATEGQ